MANTSFLGPVRSAAGFSAFDRASTTTNVSIPLATQGTGVVIPTVGPVVNFALVTTDGFIYPTEVLEARGLMQRKGFPESYDRRMFVDFLSAVKSGEPRVPAPVYSHVKYDRVPDECIWIEQPDLLIIEGLNILQPPPADRDPDRRFASDFIDLSVYVHAEEALLKSWYIERFLGLRRTIFSNPDSHFRRYAALSDDDAVETASQIWETINGRNLVENILPTRYRADVIINKGPRHRIETVQVMNR